MIRRRVVVTGDVQGVYFRDVCRTVAREQRVSGWVRNRPDGTVEAAFEGEPEAVERLVTWARQGPRTATVHGLEVYNEEPEGLLGFEIRPTPWRTE
jgi:acylphosphatase